MIATTTSAMNIVFHFCLAVPEYPGTRHDLLQTLENFVLRKIWSEAFAKEAPSLGETSTQWLAKAVEMVNVAAQRKKDDALTTV
jgi:hypothetical protein